MKDNYIFIPILLIIFFCIVCCFGIYSDHTYKMKKLELVECGIIKDFKD